MIMSFFCIVMLDLIGIESMFSGEESHGKYLDLNSVFELYVNLPNSKKLNYLAFLGEFDNFEIIPKETKSTADYAR
jgi:splicing factor 3A subunit 3